MDIVTDCRAIGCGVVDAKHPKVRIGLVCDTHHIGHEVIGRTVRLLAYQSIRVGPNRVEVAKDLRAAMLRKIVSLYQQALNINLLFVHKGWRHLMGVPHRMEGIGVPRRPSQRKRK